MNPHGNLATRVYIWVFLKKLVFKCSILTNQKDSTQRYLTPWPNIALRGGTQTFIQNHRIVLLKKINVLEKCNPKWYFQLKIIITQILYHWLGCLWHQYQHSQWKLADFLGSNHSLYPSTFIQKKIQIEHSYDTSQNVHTPYSFICFYSQSIGLLQIISMALFSVQFSALHYFIFSVYTNLNLNTMFSSTFQIFLQILNKKHYNLTFYSNFSTPAIFFEEMEPMFVIHNTSIATDDDIIQLDDEVYPVYLSRAIIIGKIILIG